MLKARGYSNWRVETDAVNVLRATQYPVSTAMEAKVISDILDGFVSHRGGNVCYVFPKREWCDILLIYICYF